MCVADWCWWMQQHMMSRSALLETDVGVAFLFFIHQCLCHPESADTLRLHKATDCPAPEECPLFFDMQFSHKSSNSEHLIVSACLSLNSNFYKAHDKYGQNLEPRLQVNVFRGAVLPNIAESSIRNMWKAVSVTLVILVTTHWSAVTPWAVCLVHVTSMVLCQARCVMSGPDSARAERGWRAPSVPTVPPTTTTGAKTFRVRTRIIE